MHTKKNHPKRSPVPATDPPSYAMQTSHTTSTGLDILHESTGGVIVMASGRAIHLTGTEWRELMQYGIARLAMEDVHEP